MLSVISNQLNTLAYSTTQKDASNPLDPITLVPDKRRDPIFGRGHSTKIGGMWTLKHGIGSPKSYELIINTELKGYTALDLNSL